MTNAADLPISLLLDIERIRSRQAIDCRKRAIELISNLLILDFENGIEDSADNNQESLLVFNALMQRERISATTIGNGIAMPHACLPSVSSTRIALITLAESIDFDSPDEAPVGIIIGFLFPESDRMEDKQSFLKIIAEHINSPKVAGALRQAESPEQVLSVWAANLSL